MPTLKHEQEEPGGLYFSTQANKIRLWLSCFSKFMDVNDGNQNAGFEGMLFLIVSVPDFSWKYFVADAHGMKTLQCTKSA